METITTTSGIEIQIAGHGVRCCDGCGEMSFVYYLHEGGKFCPECLNDAEWAPGWREYHESMDSIEEAEVLWRVAGGAKKFNRVFNPCIRPGTPMPSNWLMGSY